MAAAVVRRTLRRVCVGQLRATSDHDSNLAAAATLCADAARAGACLLCLPEAFSFIGSAAAETVAQATALDGPRLEKYRELARAHGLWLSLGGFHEAGAPGGRVSFSRADSLKTGRTAAAAATWIFSGDVLERRNETRRRRGETSYSRDFRLSRTEARLNCTRRILNCTRRVFPSSRRVKA